MTIEAFNEAIAPPGRTIVRTGEGSVMIGVHGQWVDRALATVEVMNDDTWTALLRAEGSGSYQVAGRNVIISTGDRFNLQADRPGAFATVARVHTIHTTLDRDNGAAMTFVVAGWQRSAPPL